MRAIYKRELQACFRSFVGYLYIGVTLFFIGIFVSVYNIFYGYPSIAYALASVVFLFIITIPILTMRILAEERRQKTDQLILTAPVKVTSIVLGKFLALATVLAVPVAIISLYPLYFSLFGTVPLAESYIAILAFFIYGLAGIAIGIFLSSVTESQIAAAVLSFGVLLLGYLMSGITSLISQSGNWITRILNWFDMTGKFESMLKGTFSLPSVLYFVSIIFLALLFTVQSIQKRRYHVSVKKLGMGIYSATTICIGIIGVILCNYLLTRLPSDYLEIDVTTNKMYTLTDESRQLLADLDEKITIYVLVNETYQDTVLAKTLSDYKENSEMIEVVYVDPAENPQFYSNYSDTELTSNSIIVSSGKRNKIIDYSAVYATEYDYTNYTTYTTGYDGEGQLAGAVSYVTNADMPKIYIVEGHGEITFENSYYNAIEKGNIDYEVINLLNYETVPEDAECVIIHGPSADLSKEDADKMLSYMQQGGHVLLVTAYTDQDMSNFNRLLNFYGVEVINGLVLEGDGGYYYQSPFYLLPEIAYHQITNSAYNSDNYVFVPYAQGLTATEQADTTITELLYTSDTAYIRTDFQDIADVSKQESDVEGPFSLGLKAEKNVGDTVSQGIIYSSEYLFSESADAMVAGTNLQLFSDTISAYVGEYETAIVPVKSYHITYLTLNQKQIMVSALLVSIMIPLAVLVIGIIVVIRRRKNK